jgi:sucrose phosphorylase
VDSSQINCTFYDALGRRDAEYLIARAIQCFVPGVPQVYYVGLLAGSNDIDLLRRTGVGRDINRHYYTAAELQAATKRPVVQSFLSLMRLRNSHRAFGGTFQVEPSPGDRLVLRWTNNGEWLRLDVDLSQMWAGIVGAGDGSIPSSTPLWSSSTEA